MITMAAMFVLVCAADSEVTFKKDRIETSAGDLVITFIGHGTLMLEFGGKVIHVDPWTRLADYAKLPKADIVLITHDHQDHLDPQAVQAVCTDKTAVVLTEASAKKLEKGQVMKNGAKTTVADIPVEAVPAYNMVHRRPNGEPFHPKGVGNGYVLTFGDTRVYIAGDTENVAEMKDLKDIAVAFLPMNLPYTMTPAMVADAIKMFRPRIVYPYHTGETDVAQLDEAVKDIKGVEVRYRPMK